MIGECRLDLTKYVNKATLLIISYYNWMLYLRWSGNLERVRFGVEDELVQAIGFRLPVGVCDFISTRSVTEMGLI